MKMRWYDGVLIALSALLLIAFGALLFLTGVRAPQSVYDFGLKLIQAFVGLTAVHWVRTGAWFAIAFLVFAGLVLLVWGLRQLFSLLPRKEKEEPFFNAAEMAHGKLSISLQALEHLVTRCVEDHPEFTDTSIRIVGDEERAAVNIRASLATGISMPKATAALQKEIVDYLNDCAGIPVTGVNVIVDDTKHNPAIPTPKAVYALPEQAAAKPETVYVKPSVSEPEFTPQPDSHPAAERGPEERHAAFIDESPAPRIEPTIESSIESVAESVIESATESVYETGTEEDASGINEREEAEL